MRPNLRRIFQSTATMNISSIERIVANLADASKCLKWNDFKAIASCKFLLRNRDR
jgi:hypothetical protein